MKTTEIYRKTAKAVSSFVAIVALTGAMMVPQLQAAPPTDADLAALNAELIANNGGPFLTNGKTLSVFSASTAQLKAAVLDLYVATPTLLNATDLITAIAGARGNAAAAVLDDLLEATVAAFPGSVDTLVQAAAVAAPLYAGNIAKEGLDQAEISTLPLEANGIMTSLAASIPSQAGNVAKKFLQTIDTGSNLIPAATAVSAMTALFSDPDITADVAAAVAKKAGNGASSFTSAALASMVDAAADAAPASVKLGVILSFADGAWDATNAGVEQTAIKAAVGPTYNAAIDLFYTNRAAGTPLAADLGALSAAVTLNPLLMVDLTLAAVYADSGAGAGAIVMQSATGAVLADTLAIASGATVGRPKSAEKIAQGAARGHATAANVDEIAAAVSSAAPFYAGKVVKKLNTDSTLGLLTADKNDVVKAVFIAVPEQAGKIGFWGIGKTFSGSAANDPAAIAQFGVVEAEANTTSETASLAAGIIAARKTLQTAPGVASLAAAATVNSAAATLGGTVALNLSLDKKLDSKPGLALVESLETAANAGEKFDMALAALTTLEGIGTTDFLSVLASGVSAVGGGAPGVELYDYMASLLAVKSFAANPNAKQKELDATYDSVVEILGLGLAPDGTAYSAVLNRARTFGNKSLTAAIVTGATYANWQRAGEIAKGASQGQPGQAGKVAKAALRSANLAYQNVKGNLAWAGAAYYHGVAVEINNTANGFDVNTDQAVAAASIIASAVDGVTEGIAYNGANAAKEFSDESKAIKLVIKEGTKEALAEHKSVKTAAGGNDSGDERQQVRGVVAGGFIGLDTANITAGFINLLATIVTEATKAAKMYALDIAYTAAEVLAARGDNTGAHQTAIVAAILAVPGQGRLLVDLNSAYANGLLNGAATNATFGTLAYLAANKSPSNLPVTDISGNSGL